MKHEIKAQEIKNGVPGGITRTVIWDDEAGTVEGDHRHVYSLQKVLAEPSPVEFKDRTLGYTLHDVAHDPRDFLVMLSMAMGSLEPPDVILPESLKGIESTEPRKLDKYPPGVVV